MGWTSITVPLTDVLWYRVRRTDKYSENSQATMFKLTLIFLKWIS